jgi:RHS repeat-associated protein
LATRNSTGYDSASLKFTGKEQDEETGLAYFGARFYDPSTGRFTTPDSLVPSSASAVGFNRYAYADNNPVEHVDPSGHGALAFATAISDGAQKRANDPTLGGGGDYANALAQLGLTFGISFDVPSGWSAGLRVTPDSTAFAAFEQLTPGTYEFTDDEADPIDASEVLKHARAKREADAIDRYEENVATHRAANPGMDMIGEVSVQSALELLNLWLELENVAVSGLQYKLTYSDGYYRGAYNAQLGNELVLGKFPEYQDSLDPGRVTLDVDPAFYTGNYNAGYIRGFMDNGGSVFYASPWTTGTLQFGTYGLEVGQILGPPVP